MNIQKSVVFAVVIMALTHGAFAEGLNLKPGKWEFRSTMSLPTPGGPQQHTNHECITESSMRPETLMKDLQQGCTLLDHQIEGDTMSWKVACENPGGTMTGAGNVTGSGETLTGGMKMSMSFNGQQMNMDIAWQGSYLGPCDKAE